MATEGQILNYLIASYIGLKTKESAEDVLKRARDHYNGEDKEEKLEPFTWRKSLEEAGVAQEDIRDFLKIRKNKGMTDTERSWKKMVKQTERVKISIVDAVNIAVENGWGYFKAEWYITHKNEEKQKTLFDNRESY